MTPIRIIFAILFSFSAFAGAVEKQPLDIAKVKELVKQFEVKKQMDAFKAKKDPISQLLSGNGKIQMLHNNCDPDEIDSPPRGSCMQAVCSRLPDWKCDDRHELQDVGEICRGNRSGQCISESCNRMPDWKCDDMHELKDLAESCHGVEGSCVGDICSRLADWKCDDAHELKKVGQICKNVQVSCVSYTCSRLSDWQCDDLHELEAIAEQCRESN